VPNLGNMLLIPAMLRNGDIPAPDVFCGGTPCQAFSVAGLRNSLNDARGNLSMTFCEIADEIDIQRAAAGLLPCVIKWENVPGVLSTKDNAFGCFLGALAGEDCALVAPRGKWSDAGCVFGPQRAVAWRVLDAQFFGLAQRRRRVFVVASARNGFDPTAVLFESEGVRRDSAPRRQAGQDVAGTISARTSGGGGLGTDFELGGGLQPVSAEMVG
jgi:DNA (cytosine-5)-methyltransferase 1